MIQQMSFARVLLDEAAQATELSALVPLMKMKSQGCVTLVGDHRQLPPTISNLTVDVEGFGTSLFERLASQGVQPYLLNIQYRMHPCISAFPSVMYYKGQILSGVTGSARKPPQGIAWPNADVPVTFLPVAGREDVIIVTTVRANAAGKVGFVGDTRRLNVTLTRAKRGLVVVGCFNTLSADENGWRPWLIWAQERGLIAGCEATMPEAAEDRDREHLARVPPHMNDRNLREPTRYHEQDKCSLFADLTLKNQAEAPLDIQTWEKMRCEPFLDAEFSSLPWRAFYVPFGMSDGKNKFGNYCIYIRKGATG
eukprot:g7851.t1